MSIGHPLPPAGYYPDPDVPMASRYWDGEAWAMRPISTTHIGASVATAGHLTGLVLPVMVPALLRRNDFAEGSDFERHSATEALNFQIGVLLSGALLVLGALLVPLVPGAWAVLGALWGAGVVASTVSAARATNQGQWFCYPVSVRFIRGPRTRQEAAQEAPVK